MPLLLFLAFPIIEIYLAILVADEVGFLNTVLLLCGAAFVGFGVLSLTGRTFLIELQTRAVRGEQLENVLLSQALRFFAGLLFIIPGFMTDAFAVAALLASLAPSLFAKPINQNVKRWNSRFVVFGQEHGFPPGHRPPSGPGRPWTSEPRDVTPHDEPKVIDITPGKRTDS